MYYTIYKTTNKVNGKFYIGCHKINNLQDSYIGSGDLIIKAIKKYGKEKFKKEIMHLFNSSEQMYDMERLLVNESFIKREDTYNVRIGGTGGRIRVDLEYNKNISKGLKKYYKTHFNVFKGQHYSEETKEKIGQKIAFYQNGKNNSQYGTIWITNGVENKKIKKI